MNGVDDTELNAFVDGELSPDQQAEMLALMQDDDDPLVQPNTLPLLASRHVLCFKDRTYLQPSGRWGGGREPLGRDPRLDRGAA